MCRPTPPPYLEGMPQQSLAQVPRNGRRFWQDFGSGRETDALLFIHPQNERGSARAKRDHSAMLVCAGCPVRLECADSAVRAREPCGAWGGVSESEREMIFSVLDSQHYPRAQGKGLRAAAAEIAEVVSPRVLCIA